MRVGLAEGATPALDLLVAAVRDHGVLCLEDGLFFVVGCQDQGDEKQPDEPNLHSY
jgi:hypothetical protein